MYRHGKIHHASLLPGFAGSLMLFHHIQPVYDDLVLFRKHADNLALFGLVLAADYYYVVSFFQFHKITIFKLPLVLKKLSSGILFLPALSGSARTRGRP